MNWILYVACTYQKKDKTTCKDMCNDQYIMHFKRRYHSITYSSLYFIGSSSSTHRLLWIRIGKEWKPVSAGYNFFIYNFKSVSQTRNFWTLENLISWSFFIVLWTPGLIICPKWLNFTRNEIGMSTHNNYYGKKLK